MSVWVECLIRNEFYDLKDIEAVKDELTRASTILNNYFQLEGEDKYRPEGLDCADFQVYSDTHHMSSMHLKKGYWHINTGYRYHQLFTPPLFVRKGFYDITKALGKYEAWYCDEFHLDNCGDEEWNYDAQSFEEWIEYIKTKYGPIQEYPIEEVIASTEKWFPAEPVYHDSFKDIETK